MSIGELASPTPTSRLESSRNNTSIVTSEPTGRSPAIALVPSDPSKLVFVTVPMLGDDATTEIVDMFSGRRSGSVGSDRSRSSAPLSRQPIHASAQVRTSVLRIKLETRSYQTRCTPYNHADHNEIIGMDRSLGVCDRWLYCRLPELGSGC